MGFKFGVLSFVLSFAFVAHAAQSTAEQQVEVGKLAKVLQGKTVACWKKADAEKDEILHFWLTGGTANLHTTLYSKPVKELEYELVSVGRTNAIVKVNNLGSSGVVVLFLPLYTLTNEAEFATEAVVYDGIGPGDNSGQLVALTCTKK